MLHAFAQNDVAADETTTPGYTLVNTELSYTFDLPRHGDFASQMTIGLKGENLLDQEVRNAVSFKKDEVLQPGRTVRLFGSVKF